MTIHSSSKRDCGLRSTSHAALPLEGFSDHSDVGRFSMTYSRVIHPSALTIDYSARGMRVAAIEGIRSLTFGQLQQSECSCRTVPRRYAFDQTRGKAVSPVEWLMIDQCVG